MNRPSLYAKALGVVFLIAAPALAGDFGVQQDMPLDEAIPLLDREKAKAYEHHERRIRSWIAAHPERRWKKDHSAKIQEFVDRTHRGVVVELKRRGERWVSAMEVKNYGTAFGEELGIIRGAYWGEKKQDGRVEGKDWLKIIAETRDARAAKVKEYGRKETGVIKTLDDQLVEQLEGRARDTAAHGPGGGSGRPDPSRDASNRIAFGDVEGAAEALDRAVKAGTADARAYAMRASLALDDGRYEAAADDARKALELDPASSEAEVALRFAEGRASMPGREGSGGGSDGGVEALPASEAPAVLAGAAPLKSAARQAEREARGALRLDDAAGALSRANRALELDPSNPALLNLRATIYARMRDYGRALADADAGLKLAPRNAALLRTKTYAQLRGKSYKDALAGADDLVELDPKDAYGYALRAHARGGLGDRDLMLSDLRRAAELDLRFAAAAEQASALQLPSDSDVLFLFPGETAPGTKAPAPAPRRARRFGLLAAAGAAGGGLLALGLAQLALARPARSRPADAEAAGSPGLIRGQYELSRQIGAGGMGLVFEGTDRSLGRRVAVKKMRDELRGDPRERARFVSEAKIVAALHHPNIVDIYAIVEEGPDVYLVFEYVDGKTVHDLVQSRGRLEPAQAARIARAAADALEFAHSRGVIHRDMKPSNIMIDEQGRVKVMDFGIARVAKDAMTRHSMTATIVGTPAYMAPEQEQGSVRRESDVYALAACAYEMLTGRLPFAGTGGGMMLNKVNMSYVPPARQVEGLPAALDAVFEKALQPDPERRFRSPAEFASALAAAIPAAAAIRSGTSSTDFSSKTSMPS